MKRFRRWLFNGIVAASLLLCAAAISLWVRSFWYEDWLSLSYGYTWFDMVDYRGEFGLEKHRNDPGGFDVMPSLAPTFRYYQASMYDVDNRDVPNIVDIDPARSLGQVHDFLGFRIARHFQLGTSESWEGARGIAAPAWLFVLCSASLLAAAVFAILARKKRSREGLCAQCGYDLRATPDLCPECGTIPRNPFV